MVDIVSHRSGAHSGGLVSMEAPAIPLVLLDYLTDVESQRKKLIKERDLYLNAKAAL
jgi:hypothetical protein